MSAPKPTQATADLQRRYEALAAQYDQVERSRRAYADIIDELMAVQRDFELPGGGADLPDQFRALLEALAGRAMFTEAVEAMNRQRRIEEHPAFEVYRLFHDRVRHWIREAYGDAGLPDPIGRAVADAEAQLRTAALLSPEGHR